MAPTDQLVSELRSALRHLYDSAELRKSPLTHSLGLAAAADPVSELRHTLTTAIRALQPAADVPADTQAWRAYEVLLYRYVQRCAQLEVADQLGISVRHLRREERRALEVLAGELASRFNAVAARDGGSAGQRDGSPSTVDSELAWLDVSAHDEAVDLGQALQATLALVRPLADQHHVSLPAPVHVEPISLAVHPVALRQILLSLLGATVRLAPGQQVSLSVSALNDMVQVRVRAPMLPPAAGRPKDGAGGVAGSLDMARRLAETCGGGLTVRSDARLFSADVVLPALEQLPVLLIDDNAYTLQLLQRYASATRYRLFAARTLEDALSLAGESAPQIIVLDVMMPDMDGWEVLGHLRQHPLTSHARTIVCTILAEEELAMSLGADGFLRKPVSREAFLSALDRQAYAAEPKAR